MHDLLKITHNDTLNIIGVMSGTSLDGVDLALVEFGGVGQNPAVSVKSTDCVDIPDALRREIQDCFTGTTKQVCELNKKMGLFFSECIQTFKNRLGSTHVDLIASHGQTVYHSVGHSTLQIGDSDCIAKKLGIPTMYDFRSADTAINGSGAPLVPVFDRLLNGSHQYSTIFQNLGGIGNLTYIPAKNARAMTAFDTGPANMLLDGIMRIHTNGKQTYDRNAAIAQTGRINRRLLKSLHKHPYLKKTPPKSTGHEMFGHEFSAQLMQTHQGIPMEDMMRTSVRFTAELTVRAYRDFCGSVDRVFLSGGGVKNPVLCRDFSELLGKNVLGSFKDTFGFDPDYKEAVAFAYLGYCRCRNLPSNVPEITGADKAVCLGKLAFP